MNALTRKLSKRLGSKHDSALSLTPSACDVDASLAESEAVADSPDATNFRLRFVRIIFVEARNLKDVRVNKLWADFDLYAAVYLGPAKVGKSRVFEKCGLNPYLGAQNVIAEAPVRAEDESITIVLYEYDNVLPDQEIGRFVYSLAGLRRGKSEERWIELRATDGGHVHEDSGTGKGLNNFQLRFYLRVNKLWAAIDVDIASCVGEALAGTSRVFEKCGKEPYYDDKNEWMEAVRPTDEFATMRFREHDVLADQKAVRLVYPLGGLHAGETEDRWIDLQASAGGFGGEVTMSFTPYMQSSAASVILV
ncbi:hypothetical protein H9P43_002458 [Blastocladiella emersonii ATCC 22665]|nr:hypothetical protein H9P43_002458 [Blastocladiella emersonii ATCC 22665]